MLQQTQVGRVIPKYSAFLKTFPTVADLAAAPLKDVLVAWSGLGYSRRAKYLQQAAQLIVSEYDSQFPSEVSQLIKLPGIGTNTAGAIMAYAFNAPVLFIETNIRTVFIHHFFAEQVGVADSSVLAKVAATLDHDQPREWYWALMDYGTFLKQTVGNTAQRSAGYVRQAQFIGSRRQIRGEVIRLLATTPHTLAQLQAQIPDERLDLVLADLVAEKMIASGPGGFRL